MRHSETKSRSLDCAYCKQLILAVGTYFTTVLFAAAQDASFTINGKIGVVNAPATIYLYRPGSDTPMDSAVMDKGRFRFKGITKHPASATLLLNHEGVGKRRLRDYLVVYIHEGIINVHSTDSLLHATIKDSQLNADNQRLATALRPYIRRRDAAMAQWLGSSKAERNDPENAAAHHAIITEINDQQRRIRLEFIQENPNSLISLFVLQQYAGGIPDPGQVDPLFADLSKTVRESKLGRTYAEQLAGIRSLDSGNMAPLFTQNDQVGNPVSLKDFRGRYVLLDFWASWCKPCRMDNPYIVKAYHTYKDKNFTVLSVSLDKKEARDAWLSAIEEDQLEWTNVSQLNG